MASTPHTVPATDPSEPLVDRWPRCLLRYTHPVGATPTDLECSGYHDHTRIGDVLVTDLAQHHAAEQAWSAELRRIAALPPAQRTAAVDALAIRDVDRARIEAKARGLAQVALWQQDRTAQRHRT